MIVFFFVFFKSPSFFSAPFAYAVYGAPLFLIPIMWVAYRHRHLIPKLLSITIIMALFALVYEIVGLYVGDWSYQGQYLGVIQMFGTRFPLEEFILWILLGTMTIVCWYEEFEDNFA